ncbi:3'(2'),5'-bisphosphate nucleotidase CysQ [Geodermatophilus sp. URMC 61]|uniref:3'(2'),5'-bisphosphate nucleotidase CysQ n=1 Tax=Geodermatophilus sp. URMC 61 TaxID=3423411 RepID=UPI00406CA681
MNPASDHDTARALATSAGDVLLGVRAGHFPDPTALKDAGDAGSHQFLLDRLAELRPGDAVLSEEGTDDTARLSADRVWIVDPLDGTREFSEPGRVDWAVHVALWERGELTAGAVALPAEGLTLGTVAPPPVPGRVEGPLRLAVSRSRPPALVQDLAAASGAELVPMGSAGVKAMAVLRGLADAYVHGGGQYEWDSAAPVAVARAAGLHTSRLDGSPLTYNQADPYLPDLLICRPELAERLLDALAGLVPARTDGRTHA